MANKIIKVINNAYLGCSLFLFYNSDLSDWRWWFVVVPTILFSQLAKQQDNGK